MYRRQYSVRSCASQWEEGAPAFFHRLWRLWLWASPWPRPAIATRSWRLLTVCSSKSLKLAVAIAAPAWTPLSAPKWRGKIPLLHSFPFRFHSLATYYLRPFFSLLQQPPSSHVFLGCRQLLASCTLLSLVLLHRSIDWLEQPQGSREVSELS